MKNRLTNLIVLFFIGLAAARPCSAAVLKLEFQAPTVAGPIYLIKAGFEVKGKIFRFIDVDLPYGRPWPDVQILKNGRPVDTTKNLEPGLYEARLRYAWQPNTSYKAFLHCIEDETEGPKVLEMAGISPAAGGVPATAQEGFSQSFLIEETAGIVRRGEIVYLTVTAPKASLEGAGLAVYDGERLLPCQIIESKDSIPPESQAKTHPLTRTVKIAVAIDASARGTKLLRVFLSDPPPAYPPAFALTGEGLGKTARGERLILAFSPQSGQILTIEDPMAGVKLYNKAGVIHWNPDVFTPGIAWDHSFDWNPPQSFAEKNGPLVYLNARKGPMPHIKDVFLEVKYTLAQGAPYFIAETRTRVDKDLGVIALRNDEMVLFKELFDTIVYEDANKILVKKPLRELPDKPFGLAHIAPTDLDWVGLVNDKAGYGFFCLRLETSVSNLEAGGGLPLKAGTYFYAPSDGDYVYWVRPWLYTWGEFATSTTLTALPAGSLFYEKNAYLISRWKPGTPAELGAMRMLLLNPLRVF
ncbi:MAG: hypothetical protein NTZ26_06395 [Candidatus Aminicenantes bacterium]|nr:hypothetical protein [Candidatus Aminicenantes bacterium]